MLDITLCHGTCFYNHHTNVRRSNKFRSSADDENSKTGNTEMLAHFLDHSVIYIGKNELILELRLD